MKDNSSRDILQMVTARCMFSTLTILSYLLSQDGSGTQYGQGPLGKTSPCLHGD